MTTINAYQPLHQPKLLPPTQSGRTAGSMPLQYAAKADNPGDELHDKFTQFVGESFFGQMIKAMRSTVGKPAYFYGGQGEEVFRTMLDQTMAEQMTKASAERFAEPMFAHQFPDLAKSRNDMAAPTSGLGSLNGLRRY